MDLPLSVLLTRPGEHSQLWFARDAVRHVSPSDRVRVEPTDRGLLVRGVTEYDLEVVFHALGQLYSGLRVGPLNVNFVDGSPRLEPYYSITVVVPESAMGEVMGDLSARRGLIVALEDAPLGKRIKADLPVIECFGYSTHLRFLTDGRGTFELAFLGYQPYHPRPGPEPNDVA